MSYVSNLYVADKYGNEKANFAAIVAHVRIGNFFDYDGVAEAKELFKNPVDYDVYIDSRNKETETDCYGDSLRDASLEEVCNYINNWIAEHKDESWNYIERTLYPAYKLLKTYMESEYNRKYLRVIFYAS